MRADVGIGPYAEIFRPCRILGVRVGRDAFIAPPFLVSKAFPLRGEGGAKRRMRGIHTAPRSALPGSPRMYHFAPARVCSLCK